MKVVTLGKVVTEGGREGKVMERESVQVEEDWKCGMERKRDKRWNRKREEEEEEENERWKYLDVEEEKKEERWRRRWKMKRKKRRRWIKEGSIY